jgi:YYY domain-containing protein
MMMNDIYQLIADIVRLIVELIESRPSRRAPIVITALLLIGILLAGAYFRFVGIDWDEQQHLHPDERFLTMVEAAIQLPKNIGQYFDSQTSPLNPYNNNFGLFVYGDLPIVFTKVVAAGLDSLCYNTPAHACIDQNNNNPFSYSDYGHVYLLGRVLSALFDLGTLIWLFLIARKLYDVRIALLATALGAAAVLNIQQAHFFTVDTFATFFVAATFYFIVRLSETNSWKDTIAVGLGAGMSLACRINVAPIAGIIGLALLLPIARRANWRERLADRVQAAALRLVIAALVGFIAFRIFQPYAFNGLFAFDQRFRDNMDYISKLVSGEITAPPDVQWTDRAPIVFPLINMVVWGLGIPLGLTAWLGWAFAGLEMAKKKRWLSHLLPWMWVAGYFAWQGSQWVKSMRYLLPIYPFLIMFAAVALMALYDWAKNRSRATLPSRWPLAASRLALIVVLLGTYAWAFGFTRIYTQPTTRVVASRWIYENIPTAATLIADQNGSPKQIQLAFPSTMQYLPGGQPIVTAFKIDRDSTLDSIVMHRLIEQYLPGGQPIVTAFEIDRGGTLNSIVLHRLIDTTGRPDLDVVRMSIGTVPDPNSALAQADIEAHVEVSGSLGGEYTFHFTPLTLKAGQTYYAITQLMSGSPLQAESSTLANEHWDDPVPVRVDGRDGFSNYHGEEIQGYNEDDPTKLSQLIGWLDKADFLMLSSNRLYGSIPRQPLRYPMMSEYYRLLFSGQLGFKLIASFESYPTLGPFTFPDQETSQAMGVWPDPTRCPQSNVPQCPQGQINVPLPPAEEAFSVYDHPRVLIFQKTKDFSAQDALAKLGSIPLQYALNGFTPKNETAAPNGLMLDQATWQQQQDASTWSDLFDRNSIVNQAPLVGSIVWYLIVALLGVFAFPIVFAAVPGLRDRGYGVSRVAGLVLVAFTIWLLASFKIVPFTRLTIALAVVALALVGALIAYRQREALKKFWIESRRLIVIEELIFLAAFAIFLFIRLGNPDLWHPAMGGEKPMDFAYLNAIIKSQYFPPYDPWFAGGQITYYYWGFVLIATLIKLIGVIPSIAYNFAIPTLFAMTALGAFCAAFNLVTSHQTPDASRDTSLITNHSSLFTFHLSLRNPIIIGLIAAVFVTFMGNLGETQLLEEHISAIGHEQTQFNTSIRPLQITVDTTAGLIRMATHGDQLNFRAEWWYFTPTRIIPAAEGEAGPITEMPFFTFLYADLHAHMIAMPLTLLALALAIGWLKRVPQRTWSGLGSIALAALVVGALRATNTWDYPTYLVLGSIALLFGTFASESLGSLSTWLRLAVRVGAFIGLSIVFFQPFSRNYATAYTAAEAWNGSLTPLWAYLNVHLLFLFPIVTFMLFEFKRWGWRWWSSLWRLLRAWQLPMALLGAFVVFAGALVLFSKREVILAVEPIAILIMLLIVRPRLSAHKRFWLFVVLLAVGLTLVVEVVVLKGDISRMNTVFKFYIQVWILLGICAAVALGWLADRLEQWSGWGSNVWKTFMWMLVLGSFIYVPLAARGKMLDRFVPTMSPSLNGADYMTQAAYNETGQEFPLKDDYALIQWLQDNVVGTPVIAEGQSPLYHWGGRISINTGLPSIIGWDWHQRQQRSVMPGAAIDDRLNDVRVLYQSTSIGSATDILHHYNVRYIVVGALERSYYPPEGLAKFDQLVALGVLRVAYENEGDKLYEVVR